MAKIEPDTDFSRETWRAAPSGAHEQGKAQIQCRLCSTWMHRITGWKRGQFAVDPAFDQDPVLEVNGIPTVGNQLDLWTCPNQGCPTQTETGGKLLVIMATPA